jgi:hypothetical protein
MKFRSIAVEGPIGVGKTSFVELLAKKFDAHRVLENLDNPFLQGFYEDQQGAAFQVQLFFLLSRYRQLQELEQRDLFQQITILDYIFPKDKIFAYLNLDDSPNRIWSSSSRRRPGPWSSASIDAIANMKHRSRMLTSTRSTRRTTTSSFTTRRRLCS